MLHSASRLPSNGRAVPSASNVEPPPTSTAALHRMSSLPPFPLTEMFENRDYRGSTHFFFDIGNGNSLAFFDFPGLDLGPYAEVLGGLQHLAISVAPVQWEYLKGKLDAAGVPYDHVSGSSLYFTDPDGVRLELISDPLGEMYGSVIM